MRRINRVLRWRYRRLRWLLRRSPTLRLPGYRVGAMSLGVVPIVVAVLVAGTTTNSARTVDGAAWLSGWESTSDRVLSTFQATRAAEVGYYGRQFRVRSDLAGMIFDAATSQGIDPELAFRLIRVESSFRQRVVGPAGSVGYAQVQPQTAQWLDPSVTREKLFETIEPEFEALGRRPSNPTSINSLVSPSRFSFNLQLPLSSTPIHSDIIFVPTRHVAS